MRYEHLYRIIDEIKPRRIMEIGAYDGSQAEKMIRAAQKYRQRVEYYGFDYFRPAPGYEFSKTGVRSIEEVEKRLSRTGAKIHLTEGDTRTTLKEFKGPKVDLIFIDGGHSLETIQSDWAECQRFMRSDTVTILDDYWEGRMDAGCKSLVERLENFDVEILAPGDGFGDLQIRMAKVCRS